MTVQEMRAYIQQRLYELQKTDPAKYAQICQLIRRLAELSPEANRVLFG